MIDTTHETPSPAVPDITSINSKILRLDLSAADSPEGFDVAALDQTIDRALEAMFDDLDDPAAVPCLNYYCTGYWPASAAAASPSLEDATDLPVC